jgi:hypothetical protein
MNIEKINYKEKEIATMFSIPLKTLRNCRKQQKFGKDICFTAPDSHIVLYNKEKFEKWFEANKKTAIWTLNQRMHAVIRSLKDNGWWPDGRKKNYAETRAENVHRTFTADVDLQDQHHEYYGRPNPIDKKLAHEFEKDFKKK